MTAAVSLYDAMTVTVPLGVSGQVEVRQFEVGESGSALSFLNGRGRGTPPGTYTGLYRRGHLWMSDTPDERRDHLPFLRRCLHADTRRVLVNGLGLGAVVGGLLAIESVEHVDVVEIDKDVITLVGPHYAGMAQAAGKTVTVHQGDAYTITWPAGTTWDAAWHDIWPALCTDNLAEMAKLHRRYGRRVGFQDSWGRDWLRRYRAKERRQPRWRW